MTDTLPTTDATRFVIFTLADEEFAVEVSQVQEIVEMQEITRLPRAPSFIKGVLNLRGKILPVIDLRERLGLAQAAGQAPRIVFAQLENQTVGMIVDSVTEVLPVPENSIEAPPALVADVSGAYLRGLARLGGRLLILLDLSRVLSTEEFQTLAAHQPESKGTSAGEEAAS